MWVWRTQRAEWSTPGCTTSREAGMVQDETEAGRTGPGEQGAQSPAYLGGCQAPSLGRSLWVGGRLALECWPMCLHRI